MPELKDALDALASAAHRLGVDAHEARREGVALAATVAEPAAPTYLAARDWARATGMADADDIAAANDAFTASASSGRKWRASPTPLLSHLRLTGADAGAYAEALADVVEAAATLGTTNARVADNIISTAAAQRSGTSAIPPAAHTIAARAAAGVRSGSADPSSPAVSGMLRAIEDAVPRFDPGLDPLQDPRIRESLRLLQNLGGRNVGLQNLGGRNVGGQNAGSESGGGQPRPVAPPPAGEPDADPAARHTGDEAAEATAGAATEGEAATDAETEADAGPAPSLEELLADLDAMIGLDQVKREVHQQVAMLKVDQKRTAAGMRNPDVTRHLVFVGNPGTGKTTVARMVSGIYQALKLLRKGHVVEVDRSELVAGYLGQTAIKTSEVCASALGGVLFIDEAYSLSGDQYGSEAINTLVKEMEDHRNELVVIVAGYPDPMVAFITQNPGLASRFKTTIEFADYTDEEIIDILAKLADGADYDVTPQAQEAFRTILAATPLNQAFGNGRFARNLLEEAIGRHAWRLQDVKEPTTEQLRQLLAEDFRPAGRGDLDKDGRVRPPEGAGPAEPVEPFPPADEDAVAPDEAPDAAAAGDDAAEEPRAAAVGEGNA